MVLRMPTSSKSNIRNLFYLYVILFKVRSNLQQRMLLNPAVKLRRPRLLINTWRKGRRRSEVRGGRQTAVRALQSTLLKWNPVRRRSNSWKEQRMSIRNLELLSLHRQVLFLAVSMQTFFQCTDNK